MKIIADCHLHTSFSGDSTASMETQILAGIQQGLQYMCFTDHYDPEFPYENNPDVSPGTFELDYPSYRREFLSMKESMKMLKLDTYETTKVNQNQTTTKTGYFMDSINPFDDENTERNKQ